MIIVREYDPKWKFDFESIKTELYPLIRDQAKAIEHVGSTSIAGLSAKPIIDIDIVYDRPEQLPIIIGKLETAGYSHVGDLGIKHRDAFKLEGHRIKHNLYACLEGSLALRNHMILRDHLRAHPEDCIKYSKLKKVLARQYPNNMDSYIDGKTDFILEILEKYNLEAENLLEIRSVNEKPK